MKMEINGRFRQKATTYTLTHTKSFENFNDTHSRQIGSRANKISK